MATRHRPLVSVIVPAYNAADTVGGTISSILTQTYAPLEVIVVDDGSSDRTAAIAQSYGDSVRVVSQPNCGVSAARNAGVGRANGELIAFCDADDILLPPYIEAAVERWQTAGGGRRVVTCDAYFMGSRGISTFGRVRTSRHPARAKQRLAILQSNFCTSFALVPKAVFDELEGFDERLRAVEDWDFFLRAIFDDVEIVHQPRPHAMYRLRPGSLSSDLATMLEQEDDLFRRFIAADHDLTPDERRHLDRVAAGDSPRRLRYRAEASLVSGDVSSAMRLYRRASRLSPRDIKLHARTLTLGVVPGAAGFWRQRAGHTLRGNSPDDVE